MSDYALRANPIYGFGQFVVGTKTRLGRMMIFGAASGLYIGSDARVGIGRAGSET